MGTSRASKNLLFNAYAENNLRKRMPKPKVVLIGTMPKAKEKDSQVETMRKHLDSAPSRRYRGANFID